MHAMKYATYVYTWQQILQKPMASHTICKFLMIDKYIIIDMQLRTTPS